MFFATELISNEQIKCKYFSPFFESILKISDENLPAFSARIGTFFNTVTINEQTATWC